MFVPEGHVPDRAFIVLVRAALPADAFKLIFPVEVVAEIDLDACSAVAGQVEWYRVCMVGCVDG